MRISAFNWHEERATYRAKRVQRVPTEQSARRARYTTPYKDVFRGRKERFVRHTDGEERRARASGGPPGPPRGGRPERAHNDETLPFARIKAFLMHTRIRGEHLCDTKRTWRTLFTAGRTRGSPPAAESSVALGSSHLLAACNLGPITRPTPRTAVKSRGQLLSSRCASPCAPPPPCP